jgi:hypothetical protein
VHPKPFSSKSTPSPSQARHVSPQDAFFGQTYLGRVLINAASRSAASVVQKIELAAVADQAYYKEKLA